MLPSKLLSVQTAKPVLTFGEGAFATNDFLGYLFNSLSIGPANVNRKVVVGVAFRRDTTTSPAFPTVTVAGQSCTLVVGEISSTGTSSVARVGVAVYITDAAVPTGSTADITVSYATGSVMTRCFVSTYSLVKNGTLVVESAISGSSNPTLTSIKTDDMVGVSVSGTGTTSTITALPTMTGPVSIDYESGVKELGAYMSATVTGAGDIVFTAYGVGATSRGAVVLWS